MGTVAASDFERKLRVVKNEPSTYIIDHVPLLNPFPTIVPDSPYAGTCLWLLFKLMTDDSAC
jgi:hypothetical protein